MRRRQLALLALALAGCPPARLVAGGVVPRDEAASTLAQAEVAYAHRPDATEVRRAVYLFRTAAASDVSRLEGTVGVLRSVTWLLEHGVREERAELVATGLSAAEQCQQRAPGRPHCDYWEAVARGLGAQESPATGLGELRPIMALLRRAEAAMPSLEEGGPSRALAMLLLRAPGWPVGPGDADAALVEARKALALGPQHPLNQLAEAEALAATGDVEGARAAYRRARGLGEQRAAAGDPDGADYALKAQAAQERL